MLQDLTVVPSRRSCARKQYNPAAITRGMELFHAGYSIRGAAKQVGVPEATLRKKLKDSEYWRGGGTCGKQGAVLEWRVLFFHA